MDGGYSPWYSPYLGAFRKEIGALEEENLKLRKTLADQKKLLETKNEEVKSLEDQMEKINSFSSKLLGQVSSLESEKEKLIEDNSMLSREKKTDEKEKLTAVKIFLEMSDPTEVINLIMKKNHLKMETNVKTEYFEHDD